MNGERRRAITRCSKELHGMREECNSILKRIGIQKECLEDILDEEDEARENMPESLMGSRRYEISEDASESLNEAISNLEEIISSLEDVEGFLKDAVSGQ